MVASDGAQHEQNEHEARKIERTHQFAEGQKRAGAVLADRESHRPERSDRRDLHDDSDNGK